MPLAGNECPTVKGGQLKARTLKFLSCEIDVLTVVVDERS